MSEKTTQLQQPCGLVGIYTTTANKPDADRLARMLIEQHLAACVQVEGPINSTYRWQEQIESAEEWRLLIKTTEPKVQPVTEALLKNHPYDEPEILVFSFVAGSTGYVAWAKQQLNTN